ncbi:4Fe-4S binding protein [Fuchsiella alkaliacetigena]|uniref:4Fe-4S binding protein n=1 Tax=Fuchsiella alkaliacetigena TaxID=957042 RepID=UPI00200B33A2|nr:4Fe-4S binding protein [Fuchsiella alkaliacetigena]MCK8825675.1 4Fe-4S binding protein [Fuchsiella alkaliacetigena]
MATYQKTNRVFNRIRKFSWLLVPIISLGGLYYPRLGLLVIGIMLTVMVTGFFNGRYFCGKLCPHGSLYDVLLMPISLFKGIPAVFTSKITKWLFFIFYMAMFIRRLIAVSGYWGELVFIDRLGFLFVTMYLVMPTIVGILLAILINPRTWCSICPMGTIQTIMNKLGTNLGLNSSADQQVTISALEDCLECGLCAKVCPMQLEPYTNFNQQEQFTDSECIKCQTCIENCPAGALNFDSRIDPGEFIEEETIEG